MWYCTLTNDRKFHFFLHFAELHSGSSIRNKLTLFEIIFSNVIKLNEFYYPSIVILSIL